MPFNSYIFLFLFLPVAVIGYYGLQYLKLHRVAQGFLVAMSLWFCAYGSLQSLGIFVLSACVNYLIVQIMWKAKEKHVKMAWFIVGIIANIGVLFCFKYYDFFIENINHMIGTDASLLQLALPLGISFYTFQQIAYLVDSYREECENYSFGEYMVAVSFFPKMVQGPISYLSELVPVFRKEENRKVNYENLSKGMYAFALGLAKKVLIADTLSPMVTSYYSNPDSFNATTTVFAIIWYTLQIYFDFSGYCDMAMGIAYMFNVKLPINFNSPYQADSIDAFWDKWHMTLTRFFTKYVYFPLGGSRRGKVRTYVNILVVFLVSGLWHGANWTFILWGAMHGLAKVVHRLAKKWIGYIPKWIRVTLTFAFVSFAWSLFRANSIAQAKEVWGQIVKGGFGDISTVMTDYFNELLEMKILVRFGLGGMLELYPSLILVVFTVLLLVMCFFTKNVQERVQNMKYSYRTMIVTIVLLLWSIVSLTEGNAFLYANF